MKKINLLLSVFCAALVLSSTSCTKNDDDYNEVTLTLNATQLTYNDNGVWQDVYNASSTVMSQDIKFSHSAIPEYNVFSGFVPSRNSDNADYSTGNWLEHQWSVMSKGGLSGEGTPYMIVSWNSSDAATLKPEETSCHISYWGGGNQSGFTPQLMYVNNTSYTYYIMQNGNQYSKKFVQGDSLVLNIYGYAEGGEVKGPVKCFLADYRSTNKEEWTMLKDWTNVNLESLGTVKYIYFTMESSDSGVYGMNTPAYFAIDRLRIKL